MGEFLLRNIDSVLWPAATLTGRIGSLLGRFRRADERPLVVRPGGMGDLILFCVAAEDLGLDPRKFFWLIEQRSSAWAQHLGLDYVCYDDGIPGACWRLAGRFAAVVNSEQFYGLAQATALLALGRGATLTCFSTNRAAGWANRKVAYDPDREHEVSAFQKLLAAALGPRDVKLNDRPRRLRTSAATELPIVGLGGLQSVTRAFSEAQWTRFIESWIGRGEFWIASSEIDRPMASALCARFPTQARGFEGSFSKLCGLIQGSAQVLTVDSGFLHIASYYGVPVTGLFTSGREHKWAPLAPGSRMVRRSDLACQPCTWFGQVPPCPHRLACKELDFAQHVRPV
jgi:hypothetical protein